MLDRIVFDKDGNRLPSERFLLSLMITLKNSINENISLLHFIEETEEKDDNLDMDSYENEDLLKAVNEIKKKYYS